MSANRREGQPSTTTVAPPVELEATDFGGVFAGQARSTGKSINHGDAREPFAHVLETLPFRAVEDDAATVSYVSNVDFHLDVD